MKKLFIILILSLLLNIACKQGTNTGTTDIDSPIISGSTNITGYDDLNTLFMDKYNSGIQFLNLAKLGLTQIPNFCDQVSGSLLEQVLEIDLFDNNLRSINSSLTCFPNLEVLEISYNSLVKIEGLSKLVKLQKLILHKNQIKDISGLSVLTELKELNLGFNKISMLDQVANLSGLETLELPRNQISNIQPLLGLKSLKSLKLEFNQIQSLSQEQINFLTGIGFVSIGENPMDEDVIELIQSYNP